MCGIIGYIGKSEATGLLVKGLKSLEYRGYDSSGIAVLNKNGLEIIKAKGEIKHLTFADNVYGPEFEPFCEVIVKNNLTPHVLSESAGTQMFDSLYMKEKYESMMQN